MSLLAKLRCFLTGAPTTVHCQWPSARSERISSAKCPHFFYPRRQGSVRLPSNAKVERLEVINRSFQIVVDASSLNKKMMMANSPLSSFFPGLLSTKRTLPICGRAFGRACVRRLNIQNVRIICFHLM